jgi:hypothetical protein
MTTDYGRRGKRKSNPALFIGLAAVVLLVGGFFAWNAIKGAGKVDALTGPPCPTLTAEAFAAQGVSLSREFAYGDAKFARQFGHSECTTVQTHGGYGAHPRCELTSPTVLKVTTSRGEYFYAPGTGMPVTVEVENGQPRCVLARR